MIDVYEAWYSKNGEYYNTTEIEEAIQLAYDTIFDFIPTLEQLENNPEHYNNKNVEIYKGYPLNMLDQFYITLEDILDIYSEDEGDFSYIEDRMRDTAMDVLGEVGDDMIVDIRTKEWQDLYDRLFIVLHHALTQFPEEFGKETKKPTKDLILYWDSFLESVFLTWARSVNFGHAFTLHKETLITLSVSECEKILNIPKEDSYFHVLSTIVE